jgi:hypothetical protein
VIFMTYSKISMLIASPPVLSSLNTEQRTGMCVTKYAQVSLRAPIRYNAIVLKSF